MSMETGYVVAIKGWVAADPQNLDQHAAAIAALQKAKQGDFTDLHKIMVVESSAIVARSRRTKAPAEAPDSAQDDLLSTGLPAVADQAHA